MTVTLVTLGSLSYKEKCNYLAACGIFTLSSVTKVEAFGVVLVEAMLFDKPLVTTNLRESGMSWVNQEEETGLQVPPHSPKELAKAFERLLDEELYADVSKNVRKRFENLFQREQMLESLVALYSRL